MMTQETVDINILIEWSFDVNENRFSDKPSCAYVAEELVDRFSKDVRRLTSKEWSSMFNELCDYLMNTHF